ncbi:hypothetical protein [Youngiibacter fragilis]|uniref:Uncharacterized protein n=1 Tax=Youngiibacter fragilis 232.1 TaxID=994573 RepID=V7I2C8_9CLOT|nr:hypothetical protein [Youngiibacter fragilis]ETA79152.1 hypothetical protein T472_0218280 [Youngiibacter fragilis 232.1]
MTFAEKLDFLMTLTKTSNSALAQWSNIDPSYISRLRRGDRTPAKNESYTMSMAMYFSKNCSQDFQWSAIVEMMGGNETSKSLSDRETRKDLIHSWLNQEKPGKGSMVRGFLDNMSISNPMSAGGVVIGREEPASPDLENAMITFGNQGMRESARIFLDKVIHSGKRHTLLLFSDQDTSWITEDPRFMREWAQLISKAIMTGNRIRIIHTVSRNIDEMMTAIRAWVPLYMTGAIEPYYYPKIRDGVFKRTLYVAPGTAAVSSAAMGSDLSDTTLFIVTDPVSVGSFEREFTRYLNMCKPLMRIYKKNDTTEFSEDLLDFEGESSNVRVEGPPSIYTLPIYIIERIVGSMGTLPGEAITELMRQRTELFEKNLLDNEYLHQIVLPEIDAVKNGIAEIVLSDYFCGSPGYYTVSDLTAHIRNIIRYLKDFSNYHVSVIESGQNKGYILYAKEGSGVLVSKTSPPSVTFIIKESNLTAAFWDYLDRKADTGWITEASRNETIAVLEKYIESLNRE